MKKNWFTEMVDGFFDLISTGKPWADRFVKGLVIVALLVAVVTSAVGYLGSMGQKAYVATDGLVTDTVEGSMPVIQVTLKYLALSEVGEEVPVTTTTEVPVVVATEETLEPSQATSTSGEVDAPPTDD